MSIDPTRQETTPRYPASGLGLAVAPKRFTWQAAATTVWTPGGRKDSMKTLCCNLATACALLWLPAGASAAEPTGTWRTERDLAQVRIAKCGEALCGVIVALKDPIDPATGRPPTDTENEDAAQRNRPLIGVQVVIGMKPAGAAKWTGRLYNAEDGKTYDCNLELTGANSLKVEGCIMGGLLCQAQIWTRAN
jgi:uncharacterized protein (DUF2147 family)